MLDAPANRQPPHTLQGKREGEVSPIPLRGWERRRWNAALPGRFMTPGHDCEIEKTPHEPGGGTDSLPVREDEDRPEALSPDKEAPTGSEVQNAKWLAGNSPSAHPPHLAT